MSASGKTTERVFKSILAAVLAVSLCPLMPAKEAQAQENREEGNEMAALSASVDGANAQSDDSDDAAAPQSGESGDPIVDWTTSGTARWMIDASGCLVIAPLEGEERGELENWRWFDKAPWHDNGSLIISAKIEGAIAIPTATGMFRDCSSLKSLDLSGLDASGATDMSRMFSGCSSLESLDLSSFDTSKVTDMSYMFYDCSSFSSLDLSSFDTSKVENMSCMFRGCSKLESLDLSGLDISGATDMSCMFEYCSSLSSLDLSSFVASKVTNMSFMFSGCSSLSSLDLSSFGTSRAMNMSYMFSGCSSLSSLVLSGFGTLWAKDMYYMFRGCSKLESLDLSDLDISGATNMSYMFEDCSSLKSLDLSGLDTSSVKSMSSMFKDCSSLESLDLSDLDASSTTDMSFMFYGCSSLESLDLSSFDTSRVTGMPSMFSGCSSLDSLDLSSFDTSRVTGMSSMFEGCSSLASLDLSPFDTSRVTDMSWMFYNCWSLESLDLSSFDTSRVASMSNMFYGCSGLRTVVLGAAFSFRNYNYLPTPQGENLTGKWLSSADGKAYAPEAVPNNVAATYAAQTKADISGAVISGIPTKMTATGSQLTPKPVVTFNGERLVEGRDRDYIVSYGANVEPGVGAGSVTVSAAKRGNFTGSVTVYFDIETKIVFPDVDYDNDWFAPAVTFVSSRGLITGYADSGEFGPLDTLTRGQLATILWRNACPDEAASYDASEAVNETGLSGVDDHEYYTAAANWAVREGIITGFEREDGTYDFAASSPVSFEQLITILSRLGATSDEVAAAGDDLSEFLDGDNASPWSRSPIAWAAEKGLVGGYENEDGTRTLAPGEDVSRGRAATVLMRAFDLGIMG